MIRPDGYILAGGRSSRFGADKACATLDGKPLILHARDALAPHARSVTVVAEAPCKFDSFELRTIADETPHLGPLVGLAAALADKPGDGMILVTARDLLLANDDAVRILLAAATRHDDALAMREQGRWRPFPGLYRRSLLPIVRSRLGSNDRSLRSLLERYGRALDSGALAEAIDCNTPEALDAARREGRRGEVGETRYPRRNRGAER